MLTDRDDGGEEHTADDDESRQQSFIASASEDGDIVMWDVKSKGIIQRIEGAHHGVCFCVDVHGGIMVSSGQDGFVKVFRHRPKSGPVKREDGDVNGFSGANGHGEEDEAPDAAAVADEELQRQVEAEAGSPGQHVKEEQL